jgi:hypothetical protein
MAEDFTPSISISVESLWGENANPSGTPGDMRIDPDGDAEIVRALRARAVRWLDFHYAAYAVMRYGAPEDDDAPEFAGLDFDSPAQPTTTDIERLQLHAQKIVQMLGVLHELAPTAFDDDDDEDPEPAPDPAGSRSA